MNISTSALLDKFYKYLSKIRTPGHALLVAGILASACSLLSLIGTEFVFYKVEAPIMPFVKVMAYLLPFSMVLISSFVLIRGFIVLDQRNQYLSEVADRDELTRLANRAAFRREGRDMTSQATLNKSALSLVILDVDHFKTINDTHGHLAGDLALQHLAEIMRTTCRDSDVVARWGGEEFAILLRAADVHGAQAFAERLRQSVANSRFFWEGKAVELTLSAGVTEWYAHDDFDGMLLRADKALYLAKSAGRNQVHVSGYFPEPVDGFEQDVEFSETCELNENFALDQDLQFKEEAA